MPAEAASLQRPPALESRTERCRPQDPISLFANSADAEYRGVWLRPARGEALVAIGSAYHLVGHGGTRFEQVQAAWRDLTADADARQGQRGPIVFGGFSFDPLNARTELWSTFADADLVLPERLFTLRGGSAWLTRNAVLGPTAPHTMSRAGTTTERTLPDARAWQALVGSVAAGIRTRRLGVDKVVLARSKQVTVRRPLEAVLRHLTASYPTCTVFAVATTDACFVGATPERLVAVRRGMASTVALAGSTPRGATLAEDDALAARLLADPKERTEHAVVVAALSEAMAQTCTRAAAAVEPRVYRLPNLQHLLTPIHGQVAAGRGVLDLVARLHPTPALGGYPRERALELIRECEGLDRGWYAGPIGWMDAAGQGEFVVGLRSALLRGDTATLFAGCGIVADSDPTREAAEWGWKLRPMLAALDAE